jgi:heme exporter protein D
VSHGEPAERAQSAWVWETVGVLALFLCTGFAACASFVLVVHFALNGTGESGLLGKLLIKGALFSILTAGLLAILWRHRVSPLSKGRTSKNAPTSPLRDKWGLLIVLIAAAAVYLPRLDAYPYAEPDETYYLIVARNIVLHGVYGSGDPVSGFTPFDSYNSVGPPVILPVAAAVWAGGTSFTPPRVVMAVYFLALGCAAYALILPVFGSPAAICSVILLFTAPMSVYLARSVYGEAPGLLFIILALLVWRRALHVPGWSLSALGAGMYFALALMCRSILLLALWPLLGVWLYDRMTFKRIHLPHLLAPALTVGAVYAVWLLIQSLYGEDEARLATGIIATYQHNLMFGVDSLGHSLLWLCRRPFTVFAMFTGLAFTVPVLFHRRYDPPMAVAWLLALLFLFWWVFFTTGQHPRYVWYSFAVAALCMGPLLAEVLPRIGQRKSGLLPRLGYAALVAAILLPSIGRLHEQTTYAYTYDDMKDLRALAEHVRQLPPEHTVATTFWPLERSVNYLAQRPVGRVHKADLGEASYEHIIIDQETQPALLDYLDLDDTFGRYAIASTK